MRTIAIAVLLPCALWFHTDVAAQNDPMACLDVTIKRAYDLDNDGQNVAAAIVAVTNECASTFGTVVIECAWTEGGNVIAAQSTTLSDIGPKLPCRWRLLGQAGECLVGQSRHAASPARTSWRPNRHSKGRRLVSPLAAAASSSRS
jgi:hypothetical protein